MSPSLKQKKAIPVFLVALLLACFAISTSVQAAQPPSIQNVNEFNTPFADSFSIRLFPGDCCGDGTIFIPEGKTLVVEFVSVRAPLPAGEQLVVVRFSGGDARGRDATVNLFMDLQASAFNRDLFVGSQQIRLYATDGLRYGVQRDVDEGDVLITGSVIGYLVNTP